MNRNTSGANCILLSVALAGLPLLAWGQETPAPSAPTDAQQDEAIEMPLLEVIGKPEQQKIIPGSAQIVDRETLSASRVFTTSEALRKVAGVNVRDEEGFGLRPNIGIRGLNPTRSTKVLLLEDGIPLAYAPYGDNASYYHPPVDRFDRIEVLKGAGQNLFGPQTVGGVINYITPTPPHEFESTVAFTGGNRDYFNGYASVGGNDMLLDLTRKQGHGARDNVESKLNDVNFKTVLGGFGDHAFTARANYYSEDSQVTYSGLTDAEFANFGARYNPFKNDEFEADREGLSLTHEWTLGSKAALVTNVYGGRFNRHWWRQASTTTDSQCNASVPTFSADRVAGTAVNPDACNSIQGRLREYYTYGIEPRLTRANNFLGGDNELQAGVRIHFETQDRIQKNGASPTARDGALFEDNERRNQAYSGFVQNRFTFGDFAVTPGLRVEHVRYERTNNCPNPPTCTAAPVSGSTDLTELIPSLGLTQDLGAATLFAGVHRGFSPPSTADLIDNTTGASVDLDAEESWNAELGLRGRPLPGLSYEITAFRNDFHRQIAVGSIAGGSTPLATGETLYEGLELVGRSEFGRIFNSVHNPFLELAYTGLPTAQQDTALACVVPTATGCVGGLVPGSAPGNRLPYAPRNTLTASAGYNHPLGVDIRLESVFVDKQFSDFANTVSAPAGGNGQIGEIGSSLVWNAAASYRLLRPDVTFFVTGKNLFDNAYIADRTRGILPGLPRLVQAGVEYQF